MPEFDLFTGREERLDAVIKEVTSSKESMTRFMQEAGLVDSNGQWAPMYR